MVCLRSNLFHHLLYTNGQVTQEDRTQGQDGEEAAEPPAAASAAESPDAEESPEP